MASKQPTLDKSSAKLRRMLSAPAETTERNPTPHLLWDDIDHSQTLDLGRPSRTSLVFMKRSAPRSSSPSYFTLRSYSQLEFTPERRRLIELAAADENLFLEIRCIFHHDRKVYVGSEHLDMSLADIIDCTIPMDEIHLSAILRPVARAVHHLHTANADTGVALTYGSLQASNIFIQRDGIVKLAPFGNKVCPKKATEENRRKDRSDLGDLAEHIISGSLVKSDDRVLQQKMISIAGRSVDVSSGRSPELIDILDLCFSKQGSIGSILKHPFLSLGSPDSLSRLVLNAERKAWRECIPSSETASDWI